MASERHYFDLDELAQEEDGDTDPDFDEEEEEEVEIWDLTAPPEHEWYHGALDRTTSEERLLKAARPGSYLMRESERKPGSYVLSFLGRTGLNHFKITAICGDYYIGGRQFSSLGDLVGYYTNVSCLLENEQLEWPVRPAEPITTSRRVIAKYAYEKTPDTDEIGFSPGDVFIIVGQVTDDWLWVRSMKERNLSGLVPAVLVQETGNLDPYEGREWFSNKITKEMAKDLLMDCQLGTFIIRPSDTSAGDYSLSVRCSQTVSRFRIQKQKHMYIMGGRFFDSLDAIIDRYKTEHIAENVLLMKPLLIKAGKFGGGGVAPRTESGALVAPGLRPRSVGSIIGHPNEEIKKKGWLLKRGMKKDNWKSLLFTLNNTEKQLLIHENEKRAKPKGMIDLNYGFVAPLHDSLFGRTNCFQVVVRAFSETQFYYLRADTKETKRQWMDMITKTCQGTSRVPSLRRGAKQIRSLSVGVVEAKKLPKHCHPYCVVSLDDIKLAKTQAKEGTDVLWNEDFKFEDIPSEATTLTVTLYSKGKRSKDTVIGVVSIPFSLLPNRTQKDEWYPLNTLSKAHQQLKVSVRIKAKFMHEIIMAEAAYKQLKELLLDQDLVAVRALETVCKDSSRLELAATLLRIFRCERQVVSLLRTIMTQEIEREGERGTLFRGNSLGSVLMDQFMKMIGASYLQTTLRDVVMDILDLEDDCELDPQKIPNASLLSANLQTMLSLLEKAVNAIYSSIPNCPVALRYLFGCLQKAVELKWKDFPEVKTRVVSGFLFLRLFCPAIVKPQLSSLTKKSVSSTRTLVLVAKCLQNLANLISFGGKEVYMWKINSFIEKNKEKLVAFIDELSDVPHCPMVDDDISSINLARELATIHQLCEAHKQELEKLSQVESRVKRLIGASHRLIKEEEEAVTNNSP
ncbi:ras GTPase-activating protein 1-like [Oscarella lobularis]|uniref:ras GTPase-activating protein 1-like n=1 Tax=Oscarella lobularis TaxID=121494 RepID=UPI003314334A